MAKRVLFGRKLQSRLEKLTHDAGFHIVQNDEEPFELLKYERQNPQTDLPDVISFHGLDEGYPNSIFASAWTYVGEGFSLTTIKELIAEYPYIPEKDRWVFDGEADLDQCLNEIVELVATRLLPWFDNPVNNPAGMDMRPKSVPDDAQLREGLLEDIRLSELALEQAVKEGRIEDTERHKRSIEESRRMLAELDN